jgi:hypothetical protein
MPLTSVVAVLCAPPGCAHTDVSRCQNHRQGFGTPNPCKEDATHRDGVERGSFPRGTIYKGLADRDLEIREQGATDWT